VRLEPYSVNRTKRLIKSPKLYWSDTGLAIHLAGGEPSGAHFENLILGDLLVWRDLQVPRPEVLYWRTVTNQEVDLVLELREGLLAVEVKSSSRPGPRDAQHLRAFRDEYPDLFLGGLLLHDGEETFWIADRILATPWWRVV
jgi:predicted AAA+ superfamily ATPase